MRSVVAFAASILLATHAAQGGVPSKTRCRKIDFHAKSVKLFGAIHHYTFAPGAMSNFGRVYGTVFNEKPNPTYTISFGDLELCSAGSGLRTKDTIMQVELFPVDEIQGRQLEEISSKNSINVTVVTDGPMVKTGDPVAPFAAAILSIRQRDDLQQKVEGIKKKSSAHEAAYGDR